MGDSRFNETVHNQPRTPGGFAQTAVTTNLRAPVFVGAFRKKKWINGYKHRFTN
jgi:hypothetical protein